MKFIISNIIRQLSFGLLLLTVQIGIAQDETKSKIIEPALIWDKEQLAKIATLPPNTWLKLKQLQVTGDLDWLSKDSEKRILGPIGRDYSNKLAWMPDRKRAIYFGGGHNSDPTNDVWEYDLGANTWVCLYGADENAQKKSAEWVKANLLIKDGALQTKRGGPVRLTHTFDSLNYDSNLKIAFMSENFRGAVFVDKAVIALGLGLTDEELVKQWKPGRYYLTFDPAVRKWNYITENVLGGQEACSLRYIADKKIWWSQSRQSVNYYDPLKKASNELSMKGAKGGYDCMTAYDQENQKIVVIHRPSKDQNIKTETNIYSLGADSWETIQNTASIGGSQATSYFDYDSIAKKCVLYTIDCKPNLWLFDVAIKEWTPIEAKGDTPAVGRFAGYYDPERDVIVHYNSKDIYVCRVKKISK